MSCVRAPCHTKLGGGSLCTFMCNPTRGPLTACPLCSSVKGHLCGRPWVAAPFLLALPGVTGPLKCTEHCTHRWSCDLHRQKGERTHNMIPPHCPSVCKWKQGPCTGGGWSNLSQLSRSLSCRTFFASVTRVIESGQGVLLRRELGYEQILWMQMVRVSCSGQSSSCIFLSTEFELLITFPSPGLPMKRITNIWNHWSRFLAQLEFFDGSSPVVVVVLCRMRGDYPGPDLEWDEEPAVRTPTSLCLSVEAADIYEVFQTPLPCTTVSKRGHGSPLALSLLALRPKCKEGTYTTTFTVYPLTYWTLSELWDGCRPGMD